MVQECSHDIDTFDIDIELRPDYYGDNLATIERAKSHLSERLVSVLGIKPTLHIVEPGSIERSMGKAKHVDDKRKFKN